MANDKMMISTYNDKYTASPTIRRFFVAGGQSNDLFNTIQFTVINPNSVTITPNTIESVERVQGGFVKVGFGEGLLTMIFSASLPIYTKDAKGNKVYGGDYRKSEGWLWLGALDAFVRANCLYPFSVMYHGSPAQFLEIPSYNEDTSEYSTYILKGTITRPAYSQDADNPRLIKFSFNFSGIPIQQGTEIGINVTDDTTNKGIARAISTSSDNRQDHGLL